MEAVFPLTVMLVIVRAFALLWLYVGALATIVGAAIVTNAWRYRETGELPVTRVL